MQHALSPFRPEGRIDPRSRERKKAGNLLKLMEKKITKLL